MAIVKLKFKNGKIESDFKGFAFDSCDKAEVDILAKLKSRLAIQKEGEERKDNKLQEEQQYETI